MRFIPLSTATPETSRKFSDFKHRNISTPGRPSTSHSKPIPRPIAAMFSFRFARPVFRTGATALRAPLSQRTYATAVADKLKLSLVLPKETIYKSADVVQVNIAAESGDMGILSSHVPSIEQLRPGLIEIIEEGGQTKKFFLAGGFAVMQPDSNLNINAVEGFPLDAFSADNVKSQLAEAQRLASGTGSEKEIAEAKIQVEVLESLQASLK
ncbi:ATP synthase F1 epsilon subunit [Trichophyton violaceum]|uniref:ATP synthase subunit delta, mitochondrial n=1 Tax=Trichophyton violaceum TaxID=34388 RepID=A0A178FEL1_TRIVO|nr:ATP synthase F1 epsilon subunit [Trichophyton violaceum]